MNEVVDAEWLMLRRYVWWRWLVISNDEGYVIMNDVDDRTLLCVDAIHAIMHIFGKCSKYQYSSKYQCSYLNSTYMFAVFSGIRMFSSARKVFTQKLLHERAFTQRSLHIHTGALHTDVFLHRRAFTHRRVFRQKNVYIQACLHRDIFTHRRVDTQKRLHTSFYTENTEAFADGCVYTDKLLHADAFTQTRFYTDVIDKQLQLQLPLQLQVQMQLQLPLRLHYANYSTLHCS